MQQSIIAKPLSTAEKQVVARPALAGEKSIVAKPMLAGVIYGEIAFWTMLVSMVIAITGLALYMTHGGYFDSANLLNHLWQGADSTTIWQEVGGVSQPLPWHSCFGMLFKGDMLAMLGLAVTGVAAIIGMWGAFVGTLRSRSGIYIIFALLIATVLTLSALGIIKLEM